MYILILIFIMKLTSWIDTYDLYGIEPKINVNGHNNKGTLFGFISTLISVVLMVSAGIYFSLDLFNQNNVTVVSSSIKTKDLSNIKLSNSSFFFSISLQDPNTYDAFIDEGIYKAEAYYKQAIRDNEGKMTWTAVKLNMTQCSNEYFGHIYSDELKLMPIHQMYCIPNLDINLFGTYLSDAYSFVFIQISECKNTSESSHCKPQDAIDYYLDGTFVQIIYQDNAINPDNYNNPNQPIINEFYSSISHSFFKEMHMFFKPITIKSDTGILFEDISVVNFTQYDRTIDMLSLKKGKYFGEITIKLSDCYDQITRTYVKGQTVIANIGGIIQFVRIVFFILNYILNTTALNVHLINQIFFISNAPAIGNNTEKYITTKGNSITYRHFITETISLIRSRKNRPIKTQLAQRNVVNSNNQENKKKEESNNNNCTATQFVKHKEPMIFLQGNATNNNHHENMQKDERNNNKNSPTITQLVRLKQSNTIQLNFFQTMAMCLKSQKKKPMIAYYYKGSDLISEKLDVVSIIKESYRNDLMKTLLLDQRQIQLLEISSKPELSLNDTPSKRYYGNNLFQYSIKWANKDSSTATYNDVAKSYLDLKKQIPSKVDKLLLNKFEHYLA